MVRLMVQFRLCAVLHAIKKNKNNEYVYHLFNEFFFFFPSDIIIIKGTKPNRINIKPKRLKLKRLIGT